MNKFAIVCSGQGSLDSEIFSFARHSPLAGPVIDAFSSEFNWPMLSVEAGQLNLGLNPFSQPLTVATALANWAVLRSEVPMPSYVAGYSAGEVSALGCSGGVDLQTIARICKLRCDAMEDIAPPNNGMLAVKGVTQSELQAHLAGSNTFIAIYNEDDHFVIAGSVKEIEYFEKTLGGLGAWVKRLVVSIPSHTPLLQEATTQILSKLADLHLADPRLDIPIIQGINGLPTKSLSLGVNSMARAVSEPIQWQQCMQTLSDLGVTVVLELGPGGTLSKMISGIFPEISARSVIDFRTPAGVKNWVLRELEA